MLSPLLGETSDITRPSDSSSSPLHQLMMSRSRAFRITAIPISIDREEIRSFLESLHHLPNGQLNGSNIHALTLVPDTRTQVATVVFNQEPLVFVEIDTRRPATLELESNGVKSQLSGNDSALQFWRRCLR
jgi:hypothetical protein